MYRGEKAESHIFLSHILIDLFNVYVFPKNSCVESMQIFLKYLFVLFRNGSSVPRKCVIWELI